MLVHMNGRNVDTKQSRQTREMKPNTFHKAFCKTGIDAEVLTRVTAATTLNMIIDYSL